MQQASPVAFGLTCVATPQWRLLKGWRTSPGRLMLGTPRWLDGSVHPARPNRDPQLVPKGRRLAPVFIDEVAAFRMAKER